MKIEKVYGTCGSQAVLIDAYAEWDFDSQSWELQSSYDFSWCRDCDAETNLIDQEIKETSA